MGFRVNRPVDRQGTKRYEKRLTVQNRGGLAMRIGGLPPRGYVPRRKMPCSSALVTAAVRSETFSLP